MGVTIKEKKDLHPSTPYKLSINGVKTFFSLVSNGLRLLARLLLVKEVLGKAL
jgi:hypothetical protein